LIEKGWKEAPRAPFEIRKAAAGFFIEISQVVGFKDCADKKTGKGGTNGWHSPKGVACCGWVWNECSF
jgi:hypothetical protein